MEAVANKTKMPSVEQSIVGVFYVGTNCIVDFAKTKNLLNQRCNNQKGMVKYRRQINEQLELVEHTT